MTLLELELPEIRC